MIYRKKLIPKNLHLNLLIDIGYDGFLIGERFMKSKNPALSFKNFINELLC